METYGYTLDLAALTVLCMDEDGETTAAIAAWGRA